MEGCNSPIDELVVDWNAAIVVSPVEGESEDNDIETLKRCLDVLFLPTDHPYELHDVASSTTLGLAPAVSGASVTRRTSFSDSSISKFSISNQSVSTYITARSVRSSIATFRTAFSGSQSLYAKSQASRSSWYNLLDTNKLIPDPLDEKDWSGRGEHAEFKPNERFRINDLLAVEDTLGTSATALVESVRCRRILLARKTIRCSRRMKRADALEEVKHLKRLEHSHIVRVVGTYTFKQDLAILLYPAAEYNLDSFMDSIITESPDYPDDEKTVPKLRALVSFFGCLAHALDFLHRNATKHMDIKPKNLLVAQKRNSNAPLSETIFKIYIADFGITRSYKNISEAETDSPTSFTRMYAAPEVEMKRGLPADVFSLGCVYAEMLVHLASRGRKSKRKDLMAILQSNEDQPWRSYEGNIPTVTLWLQEVIDLNRANVNFLQLYPIPNKIIGMIDPDPKRRPSARDIASCFRSSPSCCDAGPDEFALEKPDPEVAFKDRKPHSISSPRSLTTTYQNSLQEIPRPVTTMLQAALTRRSEPVFSLYNECVSLQLRFSADETFREWLMEDSDALRRLYGRIDAVMLIWQFLKRGLTLLLLFNIALSPSYLQLIARHMDIGQYRAKALVKVFLEVCVQQLHIPAERCFEIADLFGDDLMGFMKVIKLVSHVLSILRQAGKANSYLQYDDKDMPARLTIALAGPRTNLASLPMTLFPDFIESELLYIQDLERLHSVRALVAKYGFISDNCLDTFFAIIDSLLEFQHQALTQMKSSCSRRSIIRSWNRLISHNQESYDLYVSYLRILPNAMEETLGFVAEAEASSTVVDPDDATLSPLTLKNLFLTPAFRLYDYQYFLKSYVHAQQDENKSHDVAAMALSGLEEVLQTKAVDSGPKLPFLRRNSSQVLEGSHSRGLEEPLASSGRPFRSGKARCCFPVFGGRESGTALFNCYDLHLFEESLFLSIAKAQDLPLYDLPLCEMSDVVPFNTITHYTVWLRGEDAMKIAGGGEEMSHGAWELEFHGKCYPFRVRLRFATKEIRHSWAKAIRGQMNAS